MASVYFELFCHDLAHGNLRGAVFACHESDLDMSPPFPQIGNGMVAGLGMAQTVDGDMGTS